MIIIRQNVIMKINLIGNGNVAWHLTEALAPFCEITTVNSHTLEGADPAATVTFIAVSDNAIADIAGRLGHQAGIVVHTSGATPLNILSDKLERSGVIWPLKSLTKGESTDYSKLPLFIEAKNEDDLKILKEICSRISSEVHVVNSDTRLKLHLAAVFANNFTNHLVALGQDILLQEGMDPRLLVPFVKDALDKLESGTARDMQTGPARRGDSKTMDRHLGLIKDDKMKSEVYRVISQSIIQMYKNLSSK